MSGLRERTTEEWELRWVHPLAGTEEDDLCRLDLAEVSARREEVDSLNTVSTPEHICPRT
jgi:hypothetical protein